MMNIVFLYRLCNCVSAVSAPHHWDLVLWKSSDGDQSLSASVSGHVVLHNAGGWTECSKLPTSKALSVSDSRFVTPPSSQVALQTLCSHVSPHQHSFDVLLPFGFSCGGIFSTGYVEPYSALWCWVVSFAFEVICQMLSVTVFYNCLNTFSDK